MKRILRPLPRSFFERDAPAVARELLGKVIKKGVCTGIIVEVEAYALDEASHAVKKPVQGRAMRETYGQWYVYFTYGMHWCVNVTCDKGGTGGVLIRAVEPITGIAQMKKRRGTSDVLKLAKGPACLTQAFGIGKAENGKTLTKDFGIFELPQNSMIYHTSHSPTDVEIVTSPRIGIRHATELPWRFYIKGNQYVSALHKMKDT